MASEKIEAMVSEVEKMNVLELSELVSAIEEKFGVSAAAAVAVAGPVAGAAAAHHGRIGLGVLAGAIVGIHGHAAGRAVHADQIRVVFLHGKVQLFKAALRPQPCHKILAVLAPLGFLRLGLLCQLLGFAQACRILPFGRLALGAALGLVPMAAQHGFHPPRQQRSQQHTARRKHQPCDQDLAAALGGTAFF